MAQILFPASSAPGNDAVEGSGRLINAYSEGLPEGAPGQQVIRRAPGLTAFCATSETGFRGMWHDGGTKLYAAWEGELFHIDSTGAETSIGVLPSARLTFLTSTTNTANLTTYTYSAVALGTAHFNRRIVVAVFFNAADDYPPAAMTIGGVSATLLVTQSSAIALYIALVPTGTTGDIVVTYATAANNSAIGVWRLDGVSSSTPHATASTTGSGSIGIPAGGVAIMGQNVGGFDTGAFTTDYNDDVESGNNNVGGHASSSVAASVSYTGGVAAGASVAASWAASPDIVTFAKNNKTPTPDQVLVTPNSGAYTFTTSAISVLDVNSEVPNSVCFGEGYFFFTTPGGLCYASGINSTSVNSLDVIRCEARAEPLIRGVFWNGELYLFSETHAEVWASNGNPNATGFPLNRTTVIWRGLIAPLAVCGFEEGFEGGLIWVADDNSVRVLAGYQPQTISTPDVERAIEACTNKSSIRCFVYDLDGHACVVVDVAGEATWVYDLTEGGKWHERKSDGLDAWKMTGNSVKAFGKWIAGDRTSGNLYQIDQSAYDEDGTTLSFVAESIAMEAFPQRLQIPRADFNFAMGVGTDAVAEPAVKIQWSDDGGHRWSDPVSRSLGENGRRKMQVRVNRMGLTGVKGRRFRLTVDDPVYVGLLAGSMEVEARKS